MKASRLVSSPPWVSPWPSSSPRSSEGATLPRMHVLDTWVQKGIKKEGRSSMSGLAGMPRSAASLVISQMHLRKTIDLSEAEIDKKISESEAKLGFGTGRGELKML